MKTDVERIPPELGRCGRRWLSKMVSEKREDAGRGTIADCMAQGSICVGHTGLHGLGGSTGGGGVADD